MTDTLIPAAQYLRMSTDHQAYSLENQQIAIQEWASLHGFEVIKTYSDPGKSGVLLKTRIALASLLEDISSGNAAYKAVLVYDVSRWGRFQDTDEAAHYEYLCKSAGVPVHYCAEPFSSDGTMPNLILKALKRTMAAEYSRDLGERTYHRQRKVAENGFWAGSSPGFGFRRMLLDVSGRPKHKMKMGERKCLQSDRVAIVLGPHYEVECVREIFNMVLRSKGKAGPTAIARELDQRGIKRFGKKWTQSSVNEILSNPKYCGRYIWGKRERRLHGSVRLTTQSEWVQSEAIPAIVDRKTFDKVQAIRPRKASKTTRNRLLNRCRKLLDRWGNLSENVLRTTPGAPSIATIYRYFGNMWELYRELNYDPAGSRFIRERERHQTIELRIDLLNRIAALCPQHIDVIEPAPNHRRMLLVDRVLPVALMICRSFHVASHSGWIAIPHSRERNNITLVCLLDDENYLPQDFYLGPCFDKRGCYIKFSKTDAWFSNFTRLENLSDFYWDVWELQGDRTLAGTGRLNQRYSRYWSPQVL